MQNVINWRTVDSSNVRQVGWPSTGESLMVVRFKNGQAYAYLGVTRQRAVAATYSPSVGRYINQKVKPVFPSLRVPELDR